VEKRGALFKRNPGGGYIERPYCVARKKPMNSHMRVLPNQLSAPVSLNYFV
jgi:hypothetical protein